MKQNLQGSISKMKEYLRAVLGEKVTEDRCMHSVNILVRTAGEKKNPAGSPHGRGEVDPMDWRASASCSGLSVGV